MQTTTLHLFTSELVTFGSFHSHCRETGTLMVNLAFPKGIALWRCLFLPIDWKLVFSDLYGCRYSTPKLKKNQIKLILILACLVLWVHLHQQYSLF